MPRVAEGCWTAAQIADCAKVSPTILRTVDQQVLAPPTRRGPVDAVVVQIWVNLPDRADRSALGRTARALVEKGMPPQARLVVVDGTDIKLVKRGGDLLNLWEDEQGQLLVLPVGRWLAEARARDSAMP